jgi:FKBP12-rapamycin complex-associated protein
LLSTGPTELRNDAMDALCSLVSQIGSDFAIFVPMINKVSDLLHIFNTFN